MKENIEQSREYSRRRERERETDRQTDIQKENENALTSMRTRQTKQPNEIFRQFIAAEINNPVVYYVDVNN